MGGLLSFTGLLTGVVGIALFRRRAVESLSNMTFLLRYLEIILSLAGVVVIVLSVMLLSPTLGETWRVAAVTATLVGVLHGGIFFAVRHRQRQVRRAAIADAQRMLQDVINNQLAIIRGVTEASKDRDVTAAVDMVGRSVEKISLTLRGLSEESLARWESHYGNGRR